MTSNIVPFLWCRERKQKWKQKHYITDCATILKISFYPLLYQPKCRSNITTVTRWYNFYIVTLSYHTVTICHIYDKNTMSHTTSNTRENSSILKMTNVCTSNVTRCDTAVINHKKIPPPCHKFVTRYECLFLVLHVNDCEKKLIFLEMMLNFLSRNYDTYVCH